MGNGAAFDVFRRSRPDFLRRLPSGGHRTVLRRRTRAGSELIWRDHVLKCKMSAAVLCSRYGSANSHGKIRRSRRFACRSRSSEAVGYSVLFVAERRTACSEKNLCTAAAEVSMGGKHFFCTLCARCSRSAMVSSSMQHRRVDGSTPPSLNRRHRDHVQL